MIQSAIDKITAGESLSQAEMESVVDEMMLGRVPAEQIALLLTALKDKGESVAELAGAASAMRKHMTPIRHRRTGVIDTCGPGGHSSGTFNISTAAALVTAAAGVPVAKHGNRSITSKTGSADALAALGVNVSASVAVVENCLDSIGVCFCFAPALHAAMKHVAPVRKSLPFRTIFNLLGPLCNPASAPFQLLGVGRAELRPLLAQALALLGTERTLVVYGDDGIGEVSLAGPSRVTEVRAVGRDPQFTEFTWQPADFGVAPAPREALLVETPEQSAAVIRDVLAGKPGPPRDIVILNTAAALLTVAAESSPAAAAQRAAEAIDSGAAAAILAQLIERSHRT